MVNSPSRLHWKSLSPRELVVVPAGVPHRQYNTGAVTEKHLSVLAPAPEAGKPWDRGVDFTANCDDITGHSPYSSQPDRG